MRVLQLTKFYSPFRGGIESAVLQLTEGLRDAGVDVEVLCCNTQRRTNREQFSGYRVTRASSLARFLSTSMSPALLFEVMRRRSKHDVIHVHMPDPMAALALYFAKPQARVVVHWHSDVVRQRISLKLYEPLQRWLLRRADRVIATSRDYADASGTLRSWAAKVQVIPLGIRDMHSSVDPEEVAALRGALGSKRVVLAVGRMTHYKGFEVLIEAARDLPDDMRVVIVGEGELLSQMQCRVSELGLGERVLMPGELTDRQLRTYLSACDIFCLPSTSRAESFGLAMLEAMSFGKPIVASDIQGSGVPWVNQSGVTGINVPVGDPASLSEALRALAREPELMRRYGAAARARYLEHFTVVNMTTETLELYHGLLGAPRTASDGTLDHAIKQGLSVEEEQRA